MKEKGEIMMKVQYIGESFGAVSLTSNKIYECLGVELDGNALRIVDDSEEEGKVTDDGERESDI